MAARKLKRKSDEFYDDHTPGGPKKKKKEEESDGSTIPTKCERAFYKQPCIELAQSLLGCIIVRVCADGTECRGKIVETEAYLGGEDKAAHSYNGKKTERNTSMYMEPGTSYVYSIYGMYCCFNISSLGEGAAVLVRALEPLEGVESMRSRRKAAKKDKDLCSGPAKLCQAMDIGRTCDRLDLVSCDHLWVEHHPGDTCRNDIDIVERGRIGVEYAGEEWSTKPLRFYIKGNHCVSKK